MTSALAFLASSSSLALFACSFFWALINARLARGRISRTCLGGITNGSRGRSWNGCSFPENILSLRSLSWMIRIIYVEHQYHKKHIGYISVTRKEAWFLKVTVSWNIPSVHNTTTSCKSQTLVTAPRTKNDWIILPQSQKTSHLTLLFRECMCMQESISAKYG